MKSFEDGQRVRFTGVSGLHSKWDGREGVVKDSFRDYDGDRVLVLFDGEKVSISFDVDDFEAVKETYTIENAAEGFSTARMELDLSELTLIQKLIDQLNDNNDELAPTLTIEKDKK